MGIKNYLSKVGDKASDKLAKFSALSPEQLKHVQKKRDEFLSEMPKPDDESSIELTERLLAACSIEIYNSYLPQLKDLYLPMEIDAELSEEFNPDYNSRYFNITKWVTDKKENSIEKLVNVYEVLSNEKCNIALVFHRNEVKTDVYLAVINTNNDDSNSKADNYRDRLEEAVKGNFPGSELSEGYKGLIPCIKKERKYSVATVSNIPAEKSEKYISQTIEKLLDGIVPDKNKKSYTLVLLATPITDIAERKIHLSELYSALTPYAQWSTSYTVNENDTTGNSTTVSVNVGASAGVQQGQNHSQSIGESTSNNSYEAKSNSNSTSTSNSDSSGSSTVTNIINSNKSTGSKGESTSSNISKSSSLGKAITKTLGKAISRSTSTVDGIFRATNFGVNVGAGFAKSSNVSVSVGKSEAINQNFSNYNIKHTLELLEEQMKRLEESTALGMWDFAAYVLSEDCNVANNVAHSYLALTQGEKSYMSNTAVNVWNGASAGAESEIAKVICDYIRELRHPIFSLNPEVIEEEPEFTEYPVLINATTSLSGKELAYSLNFPRKSIIGLPVLQCAEFGRNISTYDSVNPTDKKIHLGNIFNMNHEEPTSVDLDLQSLASHTFITGSTGSGKSNTVYKLINEAIKHDKTFMVIEPAKGEYKDVFGNREDVNVYSTNQQYSKLLKINPFSFPPGIHVFEHLDRLVEIFNVCWPMYAAMPAVLKNAIQKSYEDCGWDLIDSTNKYGERLYPTFNDVSRNIKDIIDSSEYDSDNKGAYKGSLLTRLKSLTDGINGLIFVNDEIDNEKLFNENTIIDLSRLSSNETKSLIMGMLVIKLQEFRMSAKQERNSEIKHFTVIEEAHNLLKHSSVSTVGDSGNLVGKSVEMLSNAIAEMRTYGEGFIIVDQAPGLLDMAAIRNTNTKIIMRLPDKTDRELVGYAANLNEDQIIEVAKLPKGVGAIYQNDWVEPILCKVEKSDDGIDDYKFDYKPTTKYEMDNDKKLNIASWLSHGTKISDENTLKDIRDDLVKTGVESSTIVSILKFFEVPSKEPRMTKLGPIMCELFPSVKQAVKKAYNDTSDKIEWTRAAENELYSKVGRIHNEQLRRDIIQSIITYYIMIEINKPDVLQEWSIEGGFRI
ncbi:MAG: DUF87 domain-containing protein [Lachnospiraceae bacterium]|nr:DUF87 domain-containing protein [Lachnospiraceae bacterium]